LIYILYILFEKRYVGCFNMHIYIVLDVFLVRILLYPCEINSFIVVSQHASVLERFFMVIKINEIG